MKILGSSVLPDLEETINSVLPRSTARSSALICEGWVLSSMWKRGQPLRSEPLAEYFRSRLDPPIPSRARSVKPRCLASAANRQPVDIGKLLLYDVQPAKPFVLVRPGPQRFVARPKAPNAAALRQASISAAKAVLESGEPRSILHAGVIAFE